MLAVQPFSLHDIASPVQTTLSAERYIIYGADGRSGPETIRRRLSLAGAHHDHETF